MDLELAKTEEEIINGMWITPKMKEETFERVSFYIEKKKPKRKKKGYNAEFTRISKRLKEIYTKCVQCGDDSYLMVHHKDKNKLNNSVDNLEVLCFSCHKKHHPHLNIPFWMRH